ncbi:MAG: hypothetical protein V4662_15855 [Verrucomicrobiota bacterium]
MSESHVERRKIPWWVICWIVVLLIIAIDVSGPILAMLKQRTHSDLNKEMMKAIQVGLGHYRMEYNKWPDDPALANANTVPIKVRGPVLKALLRDNAHHLKLLDLDDSRHRRLPGLVMEQGEPELHDLWGTCFFLMGDMDLDNRIPNPELMAGAVTPPKLSSSAPKYLPSSSILFSAGPDRDPNTWADNITSWR